MLLTTGLGMMVAARRMPQAWAAPAAPHGPPSVAAGPFIFADDFDGPAGSGPDPA